MEAIIIGLYALHIVGLYAILFRGTIFEVSLKRGFYPGMLFYAVYLIYIAPAAILLNIFPIEQFWVAFKVSQGDVFWISIIVLTSYLILIVTIYLFVRYAKNYFELNTLTLPSKNYYVYSRFVYTSAILCLGLISLLWYAFDIKHALLSSLLSGESTSLTRTELRNETISRYLGYFFTMVLPLMTVIIASPVFTGKTINRILLIASVLCVSGFAGHKSPTAEVLLIYAISYLTFQRTRLSIRLVAVSVPFIFILLVLLYFLVLTQYSELSGIEDFWEFFWQRVFVAQLIGTYEAFCLNIQGYNYALHSVPFLSLFTDYPIFSKDLLLISEDRINPDEIGIKNSFFIAEAFGIGGFEILLPAIIIYAVNYCTSYVIFLKVFNFSFGENVEYNKMLAAMFVFYTFNVTGSFTDLLIFKLTIMCLIFTFPFMLIARFSRYTSLSFKRS